MTVDEIRALIDLAKETGVAMLEVQRGADRVRIRFAVAGAIQEVVESPQASANSGPGAAPATAGPAAEPAKNPASDSSLVLVRSPIVGTFYESSAPNAPPFVAIGERVRPGKVLCIIESMKLMNEIEAELAGIVESKLVANGQPVEYGEALFAIRPV